MLGKDEFKGLWQPRVRINVEFKGGYEDVLDGSRPIDELRRQIINGVTKGAATLAQRGETAEAKKQIAEANISVDELIKVIDDESAKRADQLHRALTILLVPPIALLVFGVAIAWWQVDFAGERSDAFSSGRRHTIRNEVMAAEL
jgi:hypothetical protein